MDESKYGKYIVTDLKMIVALSHSDDLSVDGRFLEKAGKEQVLCLDSDVIPGSFYTECTWSSLYGIQWLSNHAR
jgi:hypothetical protein